MTRRQVRLTIWRGACYRRARCICRLNIKRHKEWWQQEQTIQCLLSCLLFDEPWAEIHLWKLKSAIFRLIKERNNKGAICKAGEIKTEEYCRYTKWDQITGFPLKTPFLHLQSFFVYIHMHPQAQMFACLRFLLLFLVFVFSCSPKTKRKKKSITLN